MMAQYIEIQVRDSFDDAVSTTFDALERMTAVYPASRVSRAELVAAVKASELALRTELAWANSPFAFRFRRWNERRGRLYQLEATADRLAELIARTEEKTPLPETAT
jgi:hypothetical protein